MIVPMTCASSRHEGTSAQAHRTHLVAPGMSINRPGGMSSPHAMHLTYFSSRIRVMALSNWSSSFSSCRKAASFTLRLLMASMRLTRPMASLGGMGLVNSRYSAMRSSKSSRLRSARCSMVWRSSGDMSLKVRRLWKARGQLCKTKHHPPACDPLSLREQYILHP